MIYITWKVQTNIEFTDKTVHVQLRSLQISHCTCVCVLLFHLASDYIYILFEELLHNSPVERPDQFLSLCYVHETYTIMGKTNRQALKS